MKTVPLLLLLFVSLLQSSAYRIGDAVGILLHTTSHPHLEAYRHQMPRFGVSTKARFDISSLTNQNDLVQSIDRWNRVERSKEDIRLSISFDEGFHHIPWIDVRTNRHTLEKLLITFVFSASDGSIHAVHRETTYQDGADSSKSFVLEYIWIEEADVDTQAGALMLLLCVGLVVLIGMVSECYASESIQKRERGKDSSFLSSSNEGFEKRL